MYGSSPDAQPAHHTRIGASGRARGKQLRHDLVGQVLPRLGIAEEAGDVDQQGVEQLGELLAVELQVVEVVLVALRPDRAIRLATRRWMVERL